MIYYVNRNDRSIIGYRDETAKALMALQHQKHVRTDNDL